jgi:hypothetical protein
MIDVRVCREIKFPAARVWSLLSNFGDLSWTKGWSKLETEGDDIGMIRRIIIDGMEPIEEILESMDHGQRRFSYRIPRMPMPVSDYRADVEVAAVDEYMSRITWHCTATAEGVSEAEATTIMHATYGQLLDWVEAELSSRG